jgi:hypothetical protein
VIKNNPEEYVTIGMVQEQRRKRWLEDRAASSVTSSEDVPVVPVVTDLLEALRELNEALDDGLCNSGTPGFDSNRLGRAQVQAVAAIARAEVAQ